MLPKQDTTFVFVQKGPVGERSVAIGDLNPAIPFINTHHEKLVGIGEVGLDFTPFYTKEVGSKDVQREVLKKQVNL